MAGSVFMLYLTNTWNHRFINNPKDSKSYDHDMHNYKTLCDSGIHMTDFSGKCFKCNDQVFTREDKHNGL